MRCIRTLKGGYDYLGNITFSQRKENKELVGFEFQCRKCLACRLNNSREKAIRAVHEAKECPRGSIFVTATYKELKSPYLNYADWQGFMKRLREEITRNVTDKEVRKALRVGFMVTGEYGDKTKRPHWHAILFNYEPHDGRYKYSNDRGDKVYESETLTRLWKHGIIEYGNVTIESAGYVARYAAKKLNHGRDGEHDYEPVHRTSCVNAMGKRWIEKYWKQTFEQGFVRLPNGQPIRIPRYYEDWCKKHQPEMYEHYVTNVKTEVMKRAEEKKREEDLIDYSNMLNYRGGAPVPLRRGQVKENILLRKFKRLQEYVKL